MKTKKTLYPVDYTTFGGELEIEDFNTSVPNTIKRTSLRLLQNQTIRQNGQTKQTKSLQDMPYPVTLEELRKQKLISNTNGRPLPGLTDEAWQTEFQIRKLFLTPYGRHIKKMGGKYSTDVSSWNEEEKGSYLGITNWQSYCQYINSVLSSIRRGQVDYCYYIYQILDLAKFHYDTLCTRYCGGYWEVWLEPASRTPRQEPRI